MTSTPHTPTTDLQTTKVILVPLSPIPISPVPLSPFPYPYLPWPYSLLLTLYLYALSAGSSHHRHQGGEDLGEQSSYGPSKPHASSMHMLGQQQSGGRAADWSRMGTLECGLVVRISHLKMKCWQCGGPHPLCDCNAPPHLSLPTLLKLSRCSLASSGPFSPLPSSPCQPLALPLPRTHCAIPHPAPPSPIIPASHPPCPSLTFQAFHWSPWGC